MNIQLLSFPGCPNARAACEALQRSLERIGLPPEFEQIDVTAPDAPERLRAWGSPTILVNGRDVAGEQPAGLCCRLYGTGRARGLPPDDLIGRALEDAKGRQRR